MVGKGKGRVEGEREREKQRFRFRSGLLVSTAVLLTVELGFRCESVFDLRPAADPGWVGLKAAYYCFIFGIEVVVVYLFVGMRALGYEY